MRAAPPAPRRKGCRKRRPGQLRDVSWLAPVLLRLRDLGDYEAALLMKAKIEACLAAVVSEDSDEALTGAAAGLLRDAQGRTVESFEPGMILYRRGMGSVEVVNPSGGGSHAAFARRALEAAAVGAGLTYDQVSGDLTQANYSSLRAGKIEFRRLTQVTARLLGRTTAGSGAIEELAATKGLVLEAGDLKARFCYGWALSDEGSELVGGTAIVIDYVPHDMVVEEVIIGLAAQSTSGPVTVDVNYNGSSIFSANPSIDANENTNLTGTAGTFATTSLAKGGRLSFDIDADGTGAKGLKLWLRGTWA